jgi:branched-chain amino acid transport system ATP-binding protein
LEVKALESGYGKKQILFGMDLAVGSGEMVGIVGPNGSGKSTFVKSVFGLVQPWSGTVTLLGQTLNEANATEKVRAGLGLVIQGARAFNGLTVRENLYVGAQAVFGRAEARLRVEEMEERFPLLAKRRNDLALRLSGGQRQTLALARALVARPTVLLLDEPSMGLSPSLVDQLFSTLAGLRNDGLTIVVVEQNVRAALATVDRMVVMREGRCVLETVPDEFRAMDGLVDAFLGSETLSKGGQH